MSMYLSSPSQFSEALLALSMAKAQLIARFAVEVAPSSILIMRRRAPLPRVLDTIAEDEKEAAAAAHERDAAAARARDAHARAARERAAAEDALGPPKPPVIAIN